MINKNDLTQTCTRKVSSGCSECYRQGEWWLISYSEVLTCVWLLAFDVCVWFCHHHRHHHQCHHVPVKLPTYQHWHGVWGRVYDHFHSWLDSLKPLVKLSATASRKRLSYLFVTSWRLTLDELRKRKLDAEKPPTKSYIVRVVSNRLNIVRCSRAMVQREPKI